MPGAPQITKGLELAKFLARYLYCQLNSEYYTRQRVSEIVHDLVPVANQRLASNGGSKYFWERTFSVQGRKGVDTEHVNQRTFLPWFEKILASGQHFSVAELDIIWRDTPRIGVLQMLYVFEVYDYQAEMDQKGSKLLGSKIGLTGNPSDRGPKLNSEYKQDGVWIPHNPVWCNDLGFDKRIAKQVETAAHGFCLAKGFKRMFPHRGELFANLSTQLAAGFAMAALREYGFEVKPSTWGTVDKIA